MNNKNKTSCALIKDILPLYHDGVVSEETKAIVEDHLKQCDDCAQEYKILCKELPIKVCEPSTKDSFVKMMKRKKKKQIYITIICIIITCVVLLGGYSIMRYPKGFDAAGYVEIVLDAYFDGDCEAYAMREETTPLNIEAELSIKDSEEAEKIFSAYNLQATPAEMQEYVDMINEVYANVEYVVQNAVKDDNENYTVDVLVTPIGIFDNLGAIYSEKLADAVKNGADESEYMALFNEAVKESIAMAETYEPETVTLNVAWEGIKYTDQDYFIFESDLDRLCSVAIRQ